MKIESTTGSDSWEVVGTQAPYTPSAEDEGCRLRVECKPAAAPQPGGVMELGETVCVESGELA